MIATKKRTRNVQKIAEDVLKTAVKNKGVKFEISKDNQNILVSIYQDFTDEFQSVEEVEEFFNEDTAQIMEEEEDLFLVPFINKQEPETNDPYRKCILKSQYDKRQEKKFFDDLSDKFKMIRLRNQKDKDQQIDDLINFVC